MSQGSDNLPPDWGRCRGCARPFSRPSELEDELLERRAVGQGEDMVAGRRETGFPEDADRGDVVLCDVGGERTGGLVMEKLRQRRRRDAAAPELASNPVADEPVGAIGP